VSGVQDGGQPRCPREDLRRARGVGGLLLMTLGGITYAQERDDDRRV
jgi:hypothetical protein